MLKKAGIFVGSLIASLAIFLPVFVQAAILPKCNPLPNSLPPRLPSCGVNDLFALLVNIYNFLLGLAGLVFLLMLIWGGVRMLIFYLGLFDSAEKDIVSAKATVTQAIIGFIIVAMAYLIVNTLLALLGFDHDSAVGQLLHRFLQ